MVGHDRSLIGPPLLDDRASSTIEHDIMRRVREWMADGRVPSGRHEGLVRRSIGRILGYAQAGDRRSWGKCAIAFPNSTASESTCPAGLTLGPFSWMNHLVRPRQHCRRNRQAECLDGLEVDDQLYLHGLLDGEVGGLGALEDLVYVSSPPPPLRDQGSAALPRAPAADPATSSGFAKPGRCSRNSCRHYSWHARSHG